MENKWLWQPHDEAYDDVVQGEWQIIKCSEYHLKNDSMAVLINFFDTHSPVSYSKFKLQKKVHIKTETVSVFTPSGGENFH